MRIERIKINNCAQLRDVDWILPSGSVCISFEDIPQQRLFRDLLLSLFYDQDLPQSLSGYPDSVVEVWMSGESIQCSIRQEYLQKDGDLRRHVAILDETGRKVYLPEEMLPGDYLFNTQLQGFLQGGTVEWPERDDYVELVRRISNLSQGGDEGFSLRKMRSTLARAQKKVEEQRVSMELVKAEYEELRLEWENAYRQQEAERLILIEIKNLQEKDAILAEKIAVTAKIQKRLELLSQNADYRELRQLQDEIRRLEEHVQVLESKLQALSDESSADWAIIESFREECIEWAFLQKEVDRLADHIQVRSKRIDEMEDILLKAGYLKFREDEDLILGRIAGERDMAQAKLNKLMRTKQRLEKLKAILLEENARFLDLAIMRDVTELDNIRLAKKEQHLELWRSLKVCSMLDRILDKGLGLKSIAETLSSRLLDYYRRYHVSDYQEFTSQLKKFHKQQKRIEKLQRQINKLQENVNQEAKLRKILKSRNDTLGKAFAAVGVKDLLEWLSGWEGYQRKKAEQSLELEQLNIELEEKAVQEKNLAEYAERMSENLKNWGIPTTDREEVLGAVLNAARQLQERDEVKTEIEAFSVRFAGMLGERDMNQLSLILEPLAELERENRLSSEERQAEMASWDRTRVEILQKIEDLNRRLKGKKKNNSIADLEKNIELRKRQWKGHEDLRHALDDADALLELSWQEWKTKYEKVLNNEKQWIYDHYFLSPSKTMEKDTVTKRNYFSYRMAVAQLALDANTEVPLLFSVGNITDEDLSFWEDVPKYLAKLSFSRQVLFSTTDSKLIEKFSSNGWAILKKNQKSNLNNL